MAKTERYSLITESGEEFIGETDEHITPGKAVTFSKIRWGEKIICTNRSITPKSNEIYGTDILVNGLVENALITYRYRSKLKRRAIRRELRQPFVDAGIPVLKPKHYVIRPIFVEGDGMQDINLFRGEKQR